MKGWQRNALWQVDMGRCYHRDRLYSGGPSLVNRYSEGVLVMYTELKRASVEFAEEKNAELVAQGWQYERVSILAEDDEAYYYAMQIIDKVCKKHPEIRTVLDMIENDLAWKEHNDRKSAA